MLSISQIEKNIYLGASPFHLELPNYINNILCLTQEYPTYNTKCLYSVLWLPTEDWIFPGFRWLDRATNYVLECLKEDKSVLVHCRAGISRSPFVVAATLIRRDYISADKALEKIASIRPIIGLAPAYIKALNNYRMWLETHDIIDNGD